MLINIDKSTMQSALELAASVAQARATQPVLRAVVLEMRDGGILRLRATDGHRSVILTRRATGSPGITAVSADELLRYVKAMHDGPLRIGLETSSATAQVLRISSVGHARSAPIPVMDPSNFPKETPPTQKATRYALPCDALAKVLRDVAWAAATESSHPWLMAAHLEWSASGLIAIAANGHVLAGSLFDLSAQAPGSIELPRDAAALTVKLCEDQVKAALAAKRPMPQATIVVDTGLVHVDVPGARLSAAALDPWPAWRTMATLNHAVAHVRAPRPWLIDSLGSISLASGNDDVGLTVHDGKLHLGAASSSGASITDAVACESDVPEVQSLLSSAYLRNTLGMLGGDEVMLAMPTSLHDDAGGYARVYVHPPSSSDPLDATFAMICPRKA